MKFLSLHLVQRSREAFVETFFRKKFLRWQELRRAVLLTVLQLVWQAH